SGILSNLPRDETLFARFGCPDQVVSDNGPQFACAEFREFAHEFDFQHITSSPHNPQGNGQAERGVQIAKRILKQKDPLLALMCYRSTPSPTTGVSPAELLMGRKIKTTLPTLESNLQPRWPDLRVVRSKDANEKRRQAFYNNQRHSTKPLPPLKPGDAILSKLDHQNTWGTPAVVAGDSTTPRSYIVETHQGATLRRNRRHLLGMPALSGDTSPPALQRPQPEPTVPQADPAISTDTASPVVAEKKLRTSNKMDSRYSYPC
uniref:Integrase catalytic domain-containing protein n=1 Tax=Poecilia latipinna TaxID=48699 RepID=A0A3B3VJM5_9TELE